MRMGARCRASAACPSNRCETAARAVKRRTDDSSDGRGRQRHAPAIPYRPLRQVARQARCSNHRQLQCGHGADAHAGSARWCSNHSKVLTDAHLHFIVFRRWCRRVLCSQAAQRTARFFQQATALWRLSISTAAGRYQSVNGQAGLQHQLDGFVITAVVIS